MIPSLKKFGMGMIPWSPLAMGYLARPHASFKDSERGDSMGGMLMGNKITKADERINGKIEEIAKNRGTSMAIVSMAWSLAKPYITSPIIGMSSVKRVQDAVDAVNFELTKEEEESIYKLYEPRAVMSIVVS
jgi:aryl-alcohol dehydrogenase-like predicted oxidoreductase